MLLGVLICLAVWFTVSGINIKPKHLCPEDIFHELQHLQKTALSLFGPKEKKDLCASTCCRPLRNIREKNIR
ncbi:hypothetical protein TNCV_1798351 [Trichonephila clavipes]|uniref:Uncharacterized protein n=1 Tax=Trichonephila clavipes TaxID=2585209 RepID=A0A8X6VLK6_TRICX|nr:hypothetical protein TNCV_1798351 [Trichonephila clavipes]